MSNLFRALLISVVATGTAVVMVNLIQRRNTAEGPAKTGDERFVDAEKLTREEKALLSDELDAML